MTRFLIIIIIAIVITIIIITMTKIVIVTTYKVAWLLNLRGEGSSHFSGLYHSPTFQVFFSQTIFFVPDNFSLANIPCSISHQIFIGPTNHHNHLDLRVIYMFFAFSLAHIPVVYQPTTIFCQHSHHTTHI